MLANLDGIYSNQDRFTYGGEYNIRVPSYIVKENYRGLLKNFHRFVQENV
jgi:hypothetical protein